MEIELEREPIAWALHSVIGGIGKSSSLPILESVFMEIGTASDSPLRMTTTDLEIELSSTTGGILKRPSQPISVLAPARYLLNVLQAPSSKTTIKVGITDNQMVVRNGATRSRLSILNSSDFPSASNDFKPTVTVYVDAGRLKAALKEVQYAAAKNDVRYCMNGALLEITPTYLRLVATDGHRMAIRTIEQPTQTEGSTQHILPRKALGEMVKMLETQGGDKIVHLRVSKQLAQLTCGANTLTAKLIDGQFPDYQRVIPSHPHRLLLDREHMLEMIGRVRSLPTDIRGSRMTIGDGTLKLQLKNAKDEEVQDEIELLQAMEGKVEIGVCVTI